MQLYSRLVKIVILLLLLLTIIDCGGILICHPGKIGGVIGIFYPNTRWEGEPWMRTYESDISETLQNFQKVEKFFNKGHFSIEWKGYIEISEAATYTFFTHSGYGSWVFIDDILVVDNNGAHKLQEAEGNIYLTKGLHKLFIRYSREGYSENTEIYRGLDVSWAKEKESRTPLIGDFLMPPNIHPTCFWIYQIGRRVFSLLKIFWLLIICFGVMVYVSSFYERAATATILRRYIFKYLVLFIGIISIIYISGTLNIDRTIANKSIGHDSAEKISERVNNAGRLGYISTLPDDYDDPGYLPILELVSMLGKDISPKFVENMHNLAFVLSLVILSWVMAKACNHILAGWIFMILALTLKANILSLVYGVTNNRTFVIVFPCVVIGIIWGLNWGSTHFAKFRQWTGVFSVGLLIGLMKIIRKSEGLIALCVILFCLLLLQIGGKRKAIAIVTLLLGYFSITMVLPALTLVHRELKTDEFDKGNRSIISKLSSNKGHMMWFPLLGGLGKYPNSLGIEYHDNIIYETIKARYMDKDSSDWFESAPRKIYFEYMSNYPWEYIKNLARAYAELLYFIPYATSVGNLPWKFGYPPLKPGIIAEERDLRANLPGIVFNLRYRYLQLSWVEWGRFFLAFLVIGIAVTGSFLGIYEREKRNIFLSLGFYLFLLATLRVLIPQYGESLIICFWVFSFVCLLCNIEVAVGYLRTFSRLQKVRTSKLWGFCTLK